MMRRSPESSWRPFGKESRRPGPPVVPYLQKSRSVSEETARLRRDQVISKEMLHLYRRCLFSVKNQPASAETHPLYGESVMPAEIRFLRKRRLVFVETPRLPGDRLSPATSSCLPQRCALSKETRQIPGIWCCVRGDGASLEKTVDLPGDRPSLQRQAGFPGDVPSISTLRATAAPFPPPRPARRAASRGRGGAKPRPCPRRATWLQRSRGRGRRSGRHP